MEKSGIGFMGIVQIMLIVLKAIGLISWSWLVVLIPLWIDLGLTLIVVIVYVISKRL